MPALPTADWLAALADMDAAVAAALIGLDGYEARWPDPPPRPADTPLHDLAARLDGWDERLRAAGRLAEGLEREFADRAAGVAAWQQAFTTWRAGIQQPAGSTA